ncbi:MAG: uracil-DNA glycosylase [Firmicutes bacterium]|nr:uracil-DNA glycosylase [Bacillota bacterium]
MEIETIKAFNKKVVTGNGPLQADIVLIGEAPGANEQAQGIPFVGKAGQNLNEVLKKAGIEREKVYITNTVKIRPTKISDKTGKDINRPPNRKELDFFVPFLYEEINIIEPKIIVTLGNFPLKYVSENQNRVIGSCHGVMTNTNICGKEYKLFPMYHPASVIYNRQLFDIYVADWIKLGEIIRKGI